MLFIFHGWTQVNDWFIRPGGEYILTSMRFLLFFKLQEWVYEAAYGASGYGGNHIFCVRGKDIVVAIASKLAARSRDRWLLLNRYVLPAIED